MTHARLERALLLARTLPSLRAVQLYGRLLRMLRRPRPDLGPAPVPRHARGTWTVPGRRAPSLLSPTRFRFLNLEREVAGARDWDAAEAPKLWRYNLHYFDDLGAAGAGARRAWHEALIERWVRENPPGQGTGWEPYPTSLRIVSWIRFRLGGGRLSQAALHSLAVQARWLRASLELHLLGNHLLSNAKALLFAGAFVDGPEAGLWLERGRALLRRELPEQVLADGGHFERSPMYHALVVEDLLDLVNLSRALPGVVAAEDVSRWIEAVERMRRWLAAMLHPDGEIALFNDAAFGVAAAPQELERYARELDLAPVTRPPDGVLVLADSGYVRVARDELVALLDVGEIGPSYLPGHAHADTLGFELSLFGRRWNVDTGTSRYDAGAERHLQRSTRAHNTVEVDDRDSSEVWSSFRVARRARPRRLCLEERGPVLRIACAHDGYLRLPGRVLHRRRWVFAPGAFDLEDRLRSGFARACGRLHLHPEVRALDGRLEHAGLPGTRGIAWTVEGAAARAEPGRWHPEFGLELPASCLRYEFSGPAAAFHARWPACTSSS